MKKSDVCHAILRGSGLVYIMYNRTRAMPRILAWHGVQDCSNAVENFDGFQVEPNIFVSQLETMLKHYEIVPLDEIKTTERRDQRRGIAALTFDDGYKNNIEVVAPILERYGVPATFFVTTDYMDQKEPPWWYVVRRCVTQTKESSLDLTLPAGSLKLNISDKVASIIRIERVIRDLSLKDRAGVLRGIQAACGVDPAPYPMMDWNDVRSLAQRGYDIGGHTVHHISTGIEPVELVEKEVQNSVFLIEKNAGVRPVVYAYPYGGGQDVGSIMPELFVRYGVRLAVTTTEGLVRISSPWWALPRLNVTNNHRGARFEFLLSGMKFWKNGVLE